MEAEKRTYEEWEKLLQQTQKTERKMSLDEFRKERDKKKVKELFGKLLEKGKHALSKPSGLSLNVEGLSSFNAPPTFRERQQPRKSHGKR